MSRQKELSQYMTPDWAAEELVARYFPREDAYCEPSCGRGAFLRAFPSRAAAVGVELDPELARVAVRTTGRPVVVAAFETAVLPLIPTAIVGNPPFKHSTVMRFLDRAFDVLPDGGRVGFILPCFVLQTPSTIVPLSERWSIRQDLLPRNLFPRLRHPICFAVLTKGTAGKLFNFALFGEQHAVTALQRRYRQLLAEGEGSVWAAVTRAALESLGGTADLEDLYREIEGHRPTTNAFWRAKVRQTLQRIAFRAGRGRWTAKQALNV